MKKFLFAILVVLFSCSSPLILSPLNIDKTKSATKLIPSNYPTPPPVYKIEPTVFLTPSLFQYRLNVTQKGSVKSMEAFDKAIKSWNSKLGYEVFSYENENAQKLDIFFSPVLVYGKYYGKVEFTFDPSSAFLNQASLIQFYDNCEPEWKYKLCLHEIGHTLAISHSDNRSDIMWAFIDEVKANELSLEDIIQGKEGLSKLRVYNH